MNWFDGNFVVDSVVISVQEFGIGIIWIFSVCVWCIRWKLGLEISGVLVFEISVMFFFFCSWEMKCLFFLCLLCLWQVVNGVLMLKCWNSWIEWWVFFVVIRVIFCSICRVCGLMLLRLLIGVVIMNRVFVDMKIFWELFEKVVLYCDLGCCYCI